MEINELHRITWRGKKVVKNKRITFSSNQINTIKYNFIFLNEDWADVVLGSASITMLLAIAVSTFGAAASSLFTGSRLKITLFL